jgi:hypothetical protein
MTSHDCHLLPEWLGWLAMQIPVVMRKPQMIQMNYRALIQWQMIPWLAVVIQAQIQLLVDLMMLVVGDSALMESRAVMPVMEMILRICMENACH